MEVAGYMHHDIDRQYLNHFLAHGRVIGKQALDFAYQDVKAAFEYYLKHYNNGRPIIIASHSQGTWHAESLLHDYFENDSTLRKRLVAAYLIGGWVKKRVQKYPRMRFQPGKPVV